VPGGTVSPMIAPGGEMKTKETTRLRMPHSLVPVGDGLDSPVLDVWTTGEFEFWAVESGITGGPQRPPVPPQRPVIHALLDPFLSATPPPHARSSGPSAKPPDPATRRLFFLLLRQFNLWKHSHDSSSLANSAGRRQPVPNQANPPAKSHSVHLLKKVTYFSDAHASGRENPKTIAFCRISL